MLVSPIVLDLLTATTGPTAADVGRSFFRALQPFGAKAVFARARAAGGDGHVYSRISPPGWESLYADQRFADCNFLSREFARRNEAFAWSDIRLITQAELRLRDALADFGTRDGIAVPCHGSGGYSAVVSLAFDRLEALSSAERAAIVIAAVVAHGQMHRLLPHARPNTVALSPRERDCLGFIATGLSDGEIAERLGVGVTTIVSHVQNARRKLGARTRAQAVARLLIEGNL